MGVARIYTVGSPYNGSELAEVDFEQTADTMYLAHLDHRPHKLVRSSHISWSFSPVTFGPSLTPPASCAVAATTPNTDAANAGANYFPQPATYCVTAMDDVTGQESRASNSATVSNDLTLKKNYNTITWAAVAGATRYNVYKANNSQFFGYIGTSEVLTFRDDNIGPGLDRAPPAGYNPFPAANDYPSTVTLFEQRSIWGRTRNAPNAVWGSRSAQLENMDRSRPLRATDSLSFAIVAGRVNSVNQLVATTSLLALTSNSIFAVDGDGQGGVLNATSSPAPRRQIGRGSSRLPPLIVDNVVFYAPSVGDSVRTINYSFDIDGLKSNDVTVFSPHFFSGFAITSWCYSQEPRSLVWAARDDGKLLCFTWEQEQNVWGWTLCETDGVVLNVCNISESGEDRVYLVVERKVSGVTRRFIERMASHNFESQTDAFYMDCAVAGFFNPPKSTFTGLWHLEGRTDVVGLIDGISVSGLTVTNGTVTLPSTFDPGQNVAIGIPFQVDVETNPVRVNSPQTGSNLGKRQQPGDVVLLLHRTSNIMAGSDATRLFDVKQRALESYGSPDTLFSGATEPITMESKAGNEASVHIRQTKPLPFTLLGLAVEPILGG